MAGVTCPRCGTVKSTGGAFCGVCGANLAQVPQPGATAGQQVAAGGEASQDAPAAATAAPGPGLPDGSIGDTPLAPGMTLADGRYLIERPLSKGGMGTVFLAHDRRLDDKPVAVKEMVHSFASEAERQDAEAAFLAERKTLAALRHPNIPQITDFAIESGRWFMVQDFVDGEDLHKKLEANGFRGLPESDVLRWASQVLAVLDYLEHRNPQVIHRDLKPANILVDAAGRVQVVDFGVASHRTMTGTLKTGQNQLAAAMGTTGYAPREQFLGQETTLSDIYALGATMHQLLTGHNPHNAQPLFTYPPIKRLNPKISEATVRIVTRALQNDPAFRWRHAAEMKAAVDRVLSPRGPLASRRGKLLAAALALLLVVPGGGAALYLQHQAQSPATGAVSLGLVAFDRDPSTAVGASDPKAWAQAKATASAAWKAGAYTRAMVQYQKAMSLDPADAESRIYVENAQILAGGQPYWLVGVGGSFSGANAPLGRQALQGAALAQREINQAGGVADRKVVLELADDGSSPDGAAASARDAARDVRLLGFAGYAAGDRTAAALPFLAQAQIPQVSPVSGRAALTSGPFLFRLVPGEAAQGQALAGYALHLLLAGRSRPSILVLADRHDPAAAGEAAAFSAAVGTGAALAYADYTTDTSGPAEFRAILGRQGRRSGPDLVFFAGRTGQALALGQALVAQGASRTPVLVADPTADPAPLVASGQIDLSRYHLAAYFSAGVYRLLPGDSQAAQLVRALVGDYSRLFGGGDISQEAALYYDAVKLVAQAIQADADTNGTPTRPTLREALAAIRFQGAAGQIHFDQAAAGGGADAGDPVGKALLILHLDAHLGLVPERILGDFRS